MKTKHIKLTAKERDKLQIRCCLGEIDAIIDVVNKPIFRKTYLAATKWYKFQKETLEKVKYRGKIKKLPKHKLKEEV